MEAKEVEGLLGPYNPWWHNPDSWERDLALPDYRREAVEEVLADLRDLPQMVSITGPRRVGKSTAVRHTISHLIRQDDVPPGRIMYFSFDDPQIAASQDLQRVIFDLLVESHQSRGDVGYMFLDEVQRLPRWELYLKKYYDLKAPLRFVVSGSASSPIFRSSQESLLGRIKDRHLLPFSFREFCLYRLRDQPAFGASLSRYRCLRDCLLNEDASGAVDCVANLHREMEPFAQAINQAVMDYCVDGGFPEVWELPDDVRKIEYLMEQQVRKVLYEDLMILTTYRKPENVLRLFLHVLQHPGIEVNMSKIASEAGVERRIVEENLPRLEMTDLIFRMQRFAHTPLRPRQGNIKVYAVDMALRNAVLKSWRPPDPDTMGLYAENLVARELFTWPQKLEVTYFREKHREVDCVLSHGGSRYLPFEVKHRQEAEALPGLRLFMKRYGLKVGVVITRQQTASFSEGILYLPLRYFLLAA